MSRMFAQEVLRSVKGSLGRFLAIVVIVAIGCGFFAGLRMTGLGMRKSADAFWDGTHLYDLQLVSTLGVSDKTEQAVRQVPGVTAVMPSRSVDVMASFGDEQYASRVTTVDVSAAKASRPEGVAAVSGADGYLNRLVLRSGSWPSAPDECVLLEERAEHTGRVSEVHVLYGATDLDGTLKERVFKVTGYVTSPLYTSSALLGATTLGSGAIQQVLFVPQSAFDADAPYTELSIATGGAASAVTGTEPYEAAVDAVAQKLDGRLDAIADDRRAEVQKEAQDELDEKRAEFQKERDDAMAKLYDAKAQLDDAKAKLDDGQKELDDNRALLAGKRVELADGRLAWQKGADEILSQKAKLADGERQLNDAQDALNGKRAELDAGQAAWQKGADELAAKKQELEAGQAAWEQGSRELAAQRDALEQGQAQWQEAKDKTDAALAGLQGQKQGLEEQKRRLEAAQGAMDPDQWQAAMERLEGGLAQVEQGIAQAQAGLETLAAKKDELDRGAAALAAGEAQLAATKEQLDEGRRQLEAGEERLAATERQLSDGRSQLTVGQERLDAEGATLRQGQAALAAGERELASSKEQLDDGERQLAQGEEQLAQGARELADGRASYEEGLASYESERADALDKLGDAEAKLDDAQAKIDDIETPDVFVLDRTQNYGAESFRSDSYRIDRIATAFPFFFFVVAALVSLTTMTRMVEDDRGLIGTYKALGYSTGAICAKYLVYAGAASALGALVGIFSMSQLLPSVIFNAYGIIYNVPERPFPLPVEPGPALMAAALGIGITLAATLGACLSSLRETPAALMQPKAPKAGKRILLEHVRPLWKRMSFSWKVTMRNIFRYKRRFFMTVVGIAGCTALLLTGFGVRDSINDIIDKQYGELFSYDTVVGLSSDATPGEVDAVSSYLASTGKVGSEARLSSQNMLLKDPSTNKNLSLQVVVPEDAEAFGRLVKLRERVSRQPIELGPGSAVIAEKLANILGVRVGDKVSVYAQDDAGNPTGSPHEVTLTGVTENYLGSFLYMGADAYQKAFGEKPAATTIYADVTQDPEARKALADALQKMGDVDTVMFNDETIDSYRNMLKSVDSVMVVLIVAAAVLAFVVLYNLANINISERVREIASLKVLGFTRREVCSYIYREIVLIVIIGALAGLVLGVFFEGYVIVTAEVDGAMFGREIHWPSYLYAFGLTLAFAGLVLAAMTPKLAAVDMVESLKSVE